ncbi:hypothetical protein SARC_11415 [Sphaeroforma arctica JP610]|uniref:Uncharacterized protein n=1 Tax=Sphaeroforma arctica JP610 TaxID=667725 RepID=A0A0L0FH39_9EUKA|nr:hypothetical protein SARC_11415 [Sphaeroforma arctica JP610]KNC76072.1 hypothetical protein SARC_11415 [Sphaeroforma arctica JP610]|eukprot:XP_014149974.1 hypothetical protein SARC_11415 [Sphaeroforma arctica JP610]
MSLVDTTDAEVQEVAPAVESIPTGGDLLMPTKVDAASEAAEVKEAAAAADEEPKEEEHTYSRQISELIDDFDPLAGGASKTSAANPTAALSDLKGIDMTST